MTHKSMRGICDVFIIVAAVCLVLGIVVRLFESPFILGITSQAYLQFTHALLLFAIAIGLRGLLITKE